MMNRSEHIARNLPRSFTNQRLSFSRFYSLFLSPSLDLFVHSLLSLLANTNRYFHAIVIDWVWLQVCCQQGPARSYCWSYPRHTGFISTIYTINWLATYLSPLFVLFSCFSPIADTFVKTYAINSRNNSQVVNPPLMPTTLYKTLPPDILTRLQYKHIHIYTQETVTITRVSGRVHTGAAMRRSPVPIVHSESFLLLYWLHSVRIHLRLSALCCVKVFCGILYIC